ncbi:unnamed protein product [Microthlaspi erraticum]|uniref:Arabidopsis retrotransposon Orf1 C-terminal domain-containing protein n=1 Tax=Microthlaspi erraticum TaxID=1685480 RepID=A0A6D2KTK0_9BRAS|nr:unnamed protein product [Microthlaspi erraticum]
MQRSMCTLRKNLRERLREERRTKKRNDPISSESEQGEFEIGVNLVQEEGNGSPSEEGVMRLRVKRKEKRCGAFSRTCTWPSFFSYHMESYKELTCEFLASMRYHMYEEEDRADLDQGLGWITFLAKGEKRMVTFRQLEILFGFNYGEGTKWNFKERNSKGFGLQSLMECTLPQGPRQLRSGAQS